MIRQISRLGYLCIEKQLDLVKTVMDNYIEWLATKAVCDSAYSENFFPNSNFDEWYLTLAKMGLSEEPEYIQLSEIKARLLEQDLQIKKSKEMNLKKHHYIALHRLLFELIHEFSLNTNRVFNMHDYLTHLPNRKLFDLMLEGSEMQGVLMIADLDDFKKINDQFGHDMGDFILKKVGQFFLSFLDEKYIVGRYGGEEFIFYLEGLTAVEAYDVAESMRIAIEEMQLDIGSQTCSFGLCEVNSSALPYKQALFNADKALYQAKHSGRNRIQIYR